MILNHYKDQLNKAKDIPDASNTESPMEKKLLHWITQTSFYQKYSQYIEIQAQFDVRIHKISRPKLRSSKLSMRFSYYL